MSLMNLLVPLILNIRESLYASFRHSLSVLKPFQDFNFLLWDMIVATK